MQLIHLPTGMTIISFFAFWLTYQLLVPALCQKIPLYALDYRRGIYKTRGWESRRFYIRCFKVKKWKHFLPDGAAWSATVFPKKHLASTSSAYLELFLAESCRAELTHWIAIMPFWVFGLWSPPVVIPIMFVYALIMNLPCIIVQRHNRPHLAALLEFTKKRKSSLVTLLYL